jgi:hypothetical protein
LNTGRNLVEFELPPGHAPHLLARPGAAGDLEVVKEVLAGVAAIFPSPYIHVGGDEPRGMPHDLYSSYVQRVRGLVRLIGKRPLGWQESACAGLAPDDVIQYWYTKIASRRGCRRGFERNRRRTSPCLAATSRRPWQHPCPSSCLR